MSKTQYSDKAPPSESFVSDDFLEAAAYARTMSIAEVEAVITRIVNEHNDDPNFPSHVLNAARRYLFDTDLKGEQPAEYQRLYDELKVEAAMVVINSPYPEVRAVVDNHDDIHMPVNTFRTWVIGSVLVVAGAFLNQFFSIRYPAIGVGPTVAQILAVPLGKLMELLPTTEFVTFGYAWSLNPGPFNPKEHMLITIMANVGFITPYTSDIIWIQYLPLYFNQSWATRFGYQVLVALSTSLLGYGFAGLTRRFLVYPTCAIWPGSLAQIALNRAFHADKPTIADGWSISRLRWFLYCFCAMFVYFWFPDFIFTSLSYFNWMTWISPMNVSLAAITGNFGMGFNPLPTFDWNQTLVDPLINPFFTIFNYFLGALITLPIIVAIWYTNTWNTGYLPINSNYVFDNTGNLYKVMNVVGNDTLFNQVMYENYSPVYLSASYSMEYGILFALYTATLSYTLLNCRRELVNGFRSLLGRERTSDKHKDIHVRLMESYEEVPEWQYFIVLLLAVVVGAVGIGVYPTNTPPAVVLYGAFLVLIFCVPTGIIASITNVEVTFNVLAELVGGLCFPGNAIAMSYFKAYGYITASQAISFASDLKLAHYMHIPPQFTFCAQIYATVISTFVCTGILNFQMTKIPGVCTLDQPNHFICPDVNTFFTASVLWGTLGPKRMFGPGGIYNGLLCISICLCSCQAASSGPPYSLANIWPAVPIGYLFNVFIKRRYVAWWSKYNYVTTTAFSAAIAICGIVIFFAIEWRDVQINWSGNTRPFTGCDYMGCVRLPIPDQGWFGPGIGEFH
ncbi:OPT-domain-containing protein [Mycena sanguinolenta]|uniref:OPT-domain-containing protein n=1 Tax=Mycena sanguinolenta TaxID=230812 RepID=A0A8H6ZAW5_9AGAR|nr:OPT-domain-containing protein [Mycena sanguinolenta]